MKKILLAALIAAISCLSARAQMQGDTAYVSNNGTRFRVGQKLTLGIGTGTDGRFAYVLSIDLLGLVESSKRLSAEYAAKTVTITKIRKSKKTWLSKDYTVYLVFKSDENQFQGYGINIEPALLTKEVIVDGPKS
ncbi:MAG: hypothetical protein ABIN91_19085 [Mucilaginibacter sp.]|uniref:hypothetical protein n=1 Tax=Mucilaginibacter sp. TaxID=1882438 RepID=UPI00326643DF